MVEIITVKERDFIARQEHHRCVKEKSRFLFCEMSFSVLFLPEFNVFPSRTLKFV